VPVDRLKKMGLLPFAAGPFAVLWDLDGTLVESEPLHSQATAAALDGLGLRPPIGFDDDLLSVSEEGVHTALVKRVGLPLERTVWRELKWSYFEGLLPGTEATVDQTAGLAAACRHRRADGSGFELHATRG